MNKARLLALATVGVAAFAPPAAAQTPARPQPLQPPSRAAPQLYERFFESLVRELNLSADQQTQVRQILDTHQQALANWRKEQAKDFRTLRQEYDQARQANDQAALAALRKEIAQAVKQRMLLEEEMLGQIRQALSDAQKPAFEDFISGFGQVVSDALRVQAALWSLDLSKQQKAQVRDLLTEAEVASVVAERPRDRGEAWRQAVEEIRTKVLAPEQVRKFQHVLRRWQVVSAFANLDLTDRQRREIKKILDQADERLAKAEGEQAQQVLREAVQRVEKEVLTDPQRQELRSRRAQRALRAERRQQRRGGAGAAGVT
jgi:Spy/CpxP family protein refolding chaperone